MLPSLALYTAVPFYTTSKDNPYTTTTKVQPNFTGSIINAKS